MQSSLTQVAAAITQKASSQQHCWSATIRIEGQHCGTCHMIWLKNFCFCLVLLPPLAVEAHGEDRPRSSVADFSPLALSNALPVQVI